MIVILSTDLNQKIELLHSMFGKCNGWWEIDAFFISTNMLIEYIIHSFRETELLDFRLPHALFLCDQ